MENFDVFTGKLWLSIYESAIKSNDLMIEYLNGDESLYIHALLLREELKLTIYNKSMKLIKEINKHNCYKKTPDYIYKELIEIVNFNFTVNINSLKNQFFNRIISIKNENPQYFVK